MSSPISNNPPPPPQNQNNCFELSAYGYELPEALIAQRPLDQRDHARLMVIRRDQQTISHDIFANLNKYLPPQSVIVVNNSKVIPARLFAKRVHGGEVEIFLLKQVDAYRFEALLKPLKRIKDEEPLDLGQGIVAFLEDRERRVVRFNVPDVLKHLEKIGHIPLPPYIKRPDVTQDREDYQTVYAKDAGSVASPTAGLHFTQELIDQLKSQDHPFLSTTLHIGYGTFKPVETPDIRLHPMHREAYTILSEDYQQLMTFKQQGRRLVAIGTTSCRVLEAIGQGGSLTGETNIFIYPGYQFKMIDALVTNFHLPYSTLLMLVSAFGGYDLIRRAYAIAVKEQYRFYSYGDAMVII